jgi:hypothetical protein
MNKGELISEIKRYKELFGIISEQKDEILRMLGVLRDASATKAEKQEVEALLKNQNFTDAEIKAIKKGEQQVINQTLATLEGKFLQISSEISDILVGRGISKKALSSIPDGIDFIKQVEYLNYQKNVTKEISPAKYDNEIELLLGRFDTIANIGHLKRVVTTVEGESLEKIGKETIEKGIIGKIDDKLNNLFSRNKKGASNGFWGFLAKTLGGTAASGIMIYLFVKNEAKAVLPEMIQVVKDFASKGGVISLVGEPLFINLLTKNISGSADEYAKSVGLPPENITNIDKDVNNIISEENWFSSLSEDELGEFLNRMTTSYDGVNFLYFLKKFKEVKGKDFYTWLVSDINGVEGADFSAEEITTAFKKVNPTFQFIADVSYKTIAQNINQILTIYQNVSNPNTGIENIYYKDNGSNKTQPWKKFETTIGSTLSINNINNQITTFSSDEINKIKTSASNYLDEYWKSMAESGNLDNLVKKAEEVTGNASKEISNTLDENKMYDYVYDKLESEYPKFKDISIDWKRSIQKNGGITESVKGLNKILFEKRGDGGGSSGGGSGGGGNSNNVQLPPTPFKTQAEGDAFRTWVRKTYATYASQIKLDATGPINNTNIRNAYKKYGTEYQNSLSNSGGGNIQQPETVDKAKEIFDKFNDSVNFLSVNNEKFNLEYNQQVGNRIKQFLSKRYNEESSYVGAILSLYGKNISKYKTDEDIQSKIDTQLSSLQNYLTLYEGIQLKRSSGLSKILEQVSKIVVVNVVNGIPKKQTEDDDYKDMSNVTIKSIIGGGTELRKGDKGDTIVRVKEALGYDKDTTPYFTQDFDTFIIKYKGENELDNSNSNISRDLICSIKQYQQLCSTSSGQKTTAPPTNTSIPIELKYLNDFATAVGNGVPSYGTCKSLFDYYSEQALNYRRLKKVNKAPNITKEQLQPIKDKILYCQKSSDLKDRAKLDTLISQRFRIQQGDKDNPYKMDI